MLKGHLHTALFKNTGSSKLYAKSSSFKTSSKNGTLMVRLKLLIFSSISFKLVISMRLCPRSFIVHDGSLNDEPSWTISTLIECFNALNVFVMSANINFSLCRNKENLFMKDRTSVNRSKNNAVSGFNNSSLNPLTSWSALF